MVVLTDAPHIRRGTDADAVAIAELSRQLGYPSTPAQVAARFAALAARSDWVAYVAEIAGQIVGSIFVTSVMSLQRDPCAEIRWVGGG